MSDATLLCLIKGSARSDGSCEIVTNWIRSELSQHSHFPVDIVSPTENTDTGKLNQILGKADAFIIVTPEHNHSFPAALKTIIDGARSEWAAKPAAFVSYSSGLSGGVRAVGQLRGVFASLHTVGVREQVAIPKIDSAFHASGSPVDEDGLHRAFTRMHSRLIWWADALSQARARRPYRQAA